jgi:hypothetical protein
MDSGGAMKDIDDLLRSAGRESAGTLFSKLREDALPVLDHLAASLEGDIPEDEKNDLAARFACLITKLPPLAQEKWQKRMRKALGASARTIQKIVTQAARQPISRTSRVQEGNRPPARPARYRNLLYRWSGQGLEKVKFKEVNGQTIEESQPVANFIIRIEREAEVIDDLGEQRVYECRLELVDPPPEVDPNPRVTIDTDYFGNPFRLSQALLGMGHYHLNFALGDMDFIRNASSAYSRERGVEHVKTVRYIGYSGAGGGDRPAYLTPSVVVRNGRVLSAQEVLERDGVRCELPKIKFDPIKHLDLAIIPDDEFVATLRHILQDVIRVKDLDIGRCCLGHTAVAPVFGRLKGFKPYVLAVIGDTGHGKTTCTSYFQSFFGPEFTNAELPNWGYTAKALELAGHYFKDALYLIDDYKKRHFTTVSALKEATRILQNYADGTGRSRLSRSSRMMSSTYIRGMVLITGEDLPEGESSTLARVVPLPLAKKPLTQEEVSIKRRCDKRRPLYAGVMARYIAWTQLKGDAYLQERAEELFDTFLADADVVAVDADNKARILQNLALNLLGFLLWTEFAGEFDVLAEAEAGRMAQEHYEFLKSVFLGHATAVSEERPFELFLRDLRAIIDSEVVRLVRIRPKARGFETDAEQSGPRNKPLIGYEDRDHVYLLQDAVFKEVGEYRARGHIDAGEFSRRAVVDQLLNNGVLVPNANRAGTNTVKKHRITVDGDQKRVLKVERKVIRGETDAEDDCGYPG